MSLEYEDEMEYHSCFHAYGRNGFNTEHGKCYRACSPVITAIGKSFTGGTDYGRKSHAMSLSRRADLRRHAYHVTSEVIVEGHQREFYIEVLAVRPR